MILFPLQFADVGCGYFLRQDYRNGLDGRKLKRVMRMFNRRDSIKGNPMLRSPMMIGRKVRLDLIVLSIQTNRIVLKFMECDMRSD